MNYDLEFESSTTHIKLDQFPTTLYRGTAGALDNVVLYRESRLIVTNDYIYAIMMGPTGPYFALKEELVEFEMVPKVGYNIFGAHFEYFAERDGNCGCGSRLRSLILLRGVGFIDKTTTIKQR
jgi:hypothetical protein